MQRCKTQEILRSKTNGTKCRIIIYNNGYKTVFFEMDQARKQIVNDLAAEKSLENQPPIQENSSQNIKSNAFTLGIKTVAEDIAMDSGAFQLLIENSLPFDIFKIYPIDGKTVNPFQKIMPKLCCSQKQITGGKRKSRKNYSRKNRNTSRKNRK